MGDFARCRRLLDRDGELDDDDGGLLFDFSFLKVCDKGAGGWTCCGTAVARVNCSGGLNVLGRVNGLAIGGSAAGFACGRLESCM